jgi:hypothetical protein
MTDALHETAPPDPRAVRRATILRLATGLIQGLLLYGLWQADKSKVWPATQREVYRRLAADRPVHAVRGAGRVSALRWRTLAAWKGVPPWSPPAWAPMASGAAIPPPRASTAWGPRPSWPSPP